MSTRGLAPASPSVTVRLRNQPGDDLDLPRVPRSVDHYHVRACSCYLPTGSPPSKQALHQILSLRNSPRVDTNRLGCSTWGRWPHLEMSSREPSCTRAIASFA